MPCSLSFDDVMCLQLQEPADTTANLARLSGNRPQQPLNLLLPRTKPPLSSISFVNLDFLGTGYKVPSYLLNRLPLMSAKKHTTHY